MYPPQHPCSVTGQLESEINSLKREVSGKVNSHEINSINRRLDGLEHSIGEIRAEIDSIWNRMSFLSRKDGSY